MLDIDDIDGVQVITMDHGENRLGPLFVPALIDAVAGAASTQAPLVITGSGKFFSNGLDLDAFRADPAAGPATLTGVYQLLADLCRYPGVTIAAINGHAFGGGAILAGACDLRVMRVDRGYFSFPEAHLGMTMSPELDAVIQDAFPAGALRRALVTGARIAGPDAVAMGLVDGVSSEDALLPDALALALPCVGLDGPTVAGLRAPMVARSLEVLGRGAHPAD